MSTVAKWKIYLFIYLSEHSISPGFAFDEAEHATTAAFFLWSVWLKGWCRAEAKKKKKRKLSFSVEEARIVLVRRFHGYAQMNSEIGSEAESF